MVFTPPGYTDSTGVDLMSTRDTFGRLNIA